MDKRFACTVAAVLAVTIGAAALANRPVAPEVSPLYENASGVGKDSDEEARAAPEESALEYQYVIREYEGRIAVFPTDGSEEPEIVLDALVKYLPDYDREQMQKGVLVRDYQELVSLIEDYVS